MYSINVISVSSHLTTMLIWWTGDGRHDQETGYVLYYYCKRDSNDAYSYCTLLKRRIGQKMPMPLCLGFVGLSIPCLSTILHLSTRNMSEQWSTSALLEAPASDIISASLLVLASKLHYFAVLGMSTSLARLHATSIVTLSSKIARAIDFYLEEEQECTLHPFKTINSKNTFTATFARKLG
jgi:hypothetical protein